MLLNNGITFSTFILTGGQHKNTVLVSRTRSHAHTYTDIYPHTYTHQHPHIQSHILPHANTCPQTNTHAHTYTPTHTLTKVCHLPQRLSLPAFHCQPDQPDSAYPHVCDSHHLNPSVANRKIQTHLIAIIVLRNLYRDTNQKTNQRFSIHQPNM